MKEPLKVDFTTSKRHFCLKDCSTCNSLRSACAQNFIKIETLVRRCIESKLYTIHQRLLSQFFNYLALNVYYYD